MGKEGTSEGDPPKLVEGPLLQASVHLVGDFVAAVSCGLRISGGTTMAPLWLLWSKVLVFLAHSSFRTGWQLCSASSICAKSQLRTYSRRLCKVRKVLIRRNRGSTKEATDIISGTKRMRPRC
jgi:hypothetical protein